MISHEPIEGKELFLHFYTSGIPLHHSMHFVIPYGTFQVSMLHSHTRYQSDGVLLNAKMHIFFEDFTKRYYFDISHILNMRLLECNRGHVNNIEKVISLHGHFDDPDTYKELTEFIKEIYKIRKCSYCKHLWLKRDNIDDAQLCESCYFLDKQATKIQAAVRNAFSNPRYALCRGRLSREFDELATTSF